MSVPGARSDLGWRTGRRYLPDSPEGSALFSDVDRRLAGLDLLDSPVWLFDAERCQCLWANPRGLEVWRASTVDELRRRDVASSQ